MQAKHSKGYIALQLPPATLAFDVEDPKSHYAPRMKLRVSGDVVDWLRALDAKAAASLEEQEHLKDHPYKPCVQEGSYGCQLEVKPMNGTAVWLYDAEGRKTRGSLADLKRGVTVSVKASGFGIVLHRNNGGGSKICIVVTALSRCARPRRAAACPRRAAACPRRAGSPGSAASKGCPWSSAGLECTSVCVGCRSVVAHLGAHERDCWNSPCPSAAVDLAHPPPSLSPLPSSSSSDDDVGMPHIMLWCLCSSRMSSSSCMPRSSSSVRKPPRRVAMGDTGDAKMPLNDTAAPVPSVTEGPGSMASSCAALVWVMTHSPWWGSWSEPWPSA